MSPTNAASIVVLTGLEDDDKVAELLKAYLALNRLEPVEDELLPFEPEAVTMLRLASEGRVGILLTLAHGMLSAAAEAGVSAIDGEFASNFLSGVGHPVEPEEGALVLGDVDDLLLGG